MGIIRVEDNFVQKINRSTQKQAWSREGHTLLLVSSSKDCDYCEDRNSLWSPETNEEATILPATLQEIAKDYLF